MTSRILLRPATWTAAAAPAVICRAPAICREPGSPDDPGLVFFPSQGLPGVSGHAVGPTGRPVAIRFRHGTFTPGTPGWPQPESGFVTEPAAEPGA